MLVDLGGSDPTRTLGGRQTARVLVQEERPLPGPSRRRRRTGLDLGTPVN